MNVILIISDTFRRDNLSCYGGDKVHTPHIDRFTEQAFIFDRAYCMSFPTVPNRNDILTGRCTFTYKPWAPIDRNEITLPDVLNKAGVVTSLVVDTPHPFTPGFNYQRNFQAWEVIRGQENDRWKTSPRGVTLPCAPEKLRNPHGTVVQYLRNVTDRKMEADYFVARTMQAASDWLEDNYEHPFFLYIDTFDPHEPWDPPQYYVDLYDAGYEGEEVIYPRYDKCDYLTEAELKHCKALYDGEATLVDRWVGLLLDRIASLGLLKDTMVIFTTDHGFYIGEHGYTGKSLITEQYHQSLPLYPTVSAIPLLIYLPGVEKQTHLGALAQSVDMMPTILDFMGVDIPATVQGLSLMPIMRGEKETLREIAISSPTLSAPNIQVPQPTNRSSITDKEWMLIYGSQVDKVDEPEITEMVDSMKRQMRILEKLPILPELYHLTSDPNCAKNVINENFDEAKRLHKSFVEFLVSTGMPEKHLRFFREIG